MERVPRRDTHRLLAVLLGILGFLWAVHAIVVISSALDLRPYASQALAWIILAAGAAVGSALACWALNGRQAGVVEADEPVKTWRIARRLVGALSILALIAVAAVLVMAVFLPTLAYDALTYRMPAMMQWLEQGQIYWVSSGDPFRNGYPLGQEAISGVVACAFHSRKLFGVTGVLFASTGAIAVWMMALRMEVRGFLARGVAAVFFLTPILLQNAPSGYTDASFAGVLVSMLVLATLASGSDVLGSRRDMRIAVGLGMAMALAIGLKGTGLFMAVLVGAISILRAWRGRVLSWLAIGLVLLFLLPGLFWPLRNLWHTGNPFWPVTVSVGDHILWSGQGSLCDVMSCEANTPQELRSFPEPLKVLVSWLQIRGPAVGYDDRRAGLGWAWPLLAIPAMVLFLIRSRRDGWRNRDLLLILGLTAVCFLVQPMRWWSRYTVWLWGAGALTLGTLGQQLVVREKRRLLNGALAVLVALTSIEAGLAVSNIKGTGKTLLSHGQVLSDVRSASSVLIRLDSGFWDLGLEKEAVLCRGGWKPNTSSARLDGIFAQLSPPPVIRILNDDDTDWDRLKRDWEGAGCDILLLLRGSPMLEKVRSDSSVSIEESMAFEPIYILQRRLPAAL